MADADADTNAAPKLLHLTKVAVGCGDATELALRQAERSGSADLALCYTRFMPKRAAELPGGSLFWIIQHRLVARQTILSLEMAETPWGTKCAIRLMPGPIPVVALPRRAHQGWRYFAAEDAPGDLDAAGFDAEAVPPAMLRELQSLWLV